MGNKKCRIYAACGVSQTPIGRLAREEHVYRRIMKNSDLFNESELEGATKYIMDLRRRAVKNGLFESRGN